jgi:N-acetylglutamate synthase-like GNAT family acetyltransferase
MMTEISIEPVEALAPETMQMIRKASRARRQKALQPGLAQFSRVYVAKDAAGQQLGTAELRGKLGVAELTMIWVAEGARGAGLGARLLRQAEAEAREAGMDHILLRAMGMDSPGFFLHHGYREVGRLPSAQEGAVIQWLSKPLSERAAAMVTVAPVEPPAPAAAPPATAAAPAKAAAAAARSSSKSPKRRRRR